MPAHKHLIIKGLLTDPARSTHEITDALYDLVDLVNMRILDEPRARYCYEEGNTGFTGDVLLTTSHMMWHDWDRQGDPYADFQFDLYSCAPFDTQTVISYLVENFGLTNYEYKLFDRQYALVEEQSGRGFALRDAAESVEAD